MKVVTCVKLTNQTILLIGNELPVTTHLISQLSKLNNRIILLTNVDIVFDKLQKLFPTITLLRLNIYEEVDRLKLVEELNNRYLSPSCIIYNEFSFTEEMFKYKESSMFQATLESFYTALTHLDECLISFLETEADATIAYILPRLSWKNCEHSHLYSILKRTLLDYVTVLNTIHPYIRFLTLKHPLHYNSKHKFSDTTLLQQKKISRFAVEFICQLENYTYPLK